MQALFVSICQLGLISLLVLNEILAQDAGEHYTYPSNIWVVLARFICAIMLHLSVSDEMQQGLDLMKFAANMHWMFDRPAVAWLMGFLQLLTVILTELANMVVLTSNETVIDVVMNFLAFIVILDFDNLIYKTQTATLAGQMVDEKSDDRKQMCFPLSFFFRYYVTTSRAARY